MSTPAGHRAGVPVAATGNALPWLWLSLLLLIADQLSKHLALATLDLHQPVPVLPFLNWTLVYNPGA
ncbi:MAG: signal peptidase II, partial [Lysobacterales bacterium]